MIFPTPLPDEILCSLLARTCRVNGFADFRDMASTCYGNGPVSSFVDAEIDLPRFCRQTGFGYCGAEKLLQHLTWYGAQVRLGEIAWQRMDALVRGDVRLTLGSSMFPDSAVLGYCPTCRDHDLLEYGMSYWHRLHQLPIVFFCPHHGDRVVKIRIKRFTLHMGFPVPGDFASDLSRSEAIFGLVENFWRGVAVMAAEVLQGNEMPDADLIFPVLADELRRKKFVAPLLGVRLTALTELLAAHAFEHPNSTKSSKTITFLRRIAGSFDVPQSGMIMGRVVLLYWLFGGWRAVQERCRWLSVFGSESDFPMEKAATVRSKLEAQYRRTCTAYIREYPECTRLDFLRAEYRSFRWLLHNDKTWLDRQLPIPHRAGKQLVLF